MRPVLGKIVLLEMPCEDGVPVVLALLREPGGAFALSMKKGDENLSVNYWPVYQHGAWIVQDVSGPNGEATVIRGLSAQRIAGLAQEDADRHSVRLDVARLAEAIGRESMDRISVVSDVLLS